MTAAEMIRRFIGRPKKEIWAELERDMGRALPSDFAGQLSAATLDRYRAELQAITGVADAIDRLPGKKCVASSSEMTKLRLALEVTGLLPRFDPWVFSASQVARGKPAPDLFLFAAAQMEVSPADCIVIEDSKAGVQAAVAANMRVIGFTGGSHTYPGHEADLTDAGAPLVIPHMRDLPDAVQALLRSS
jgi:HAD superfamily hydrolase (TIGR01509 family)